MKRTRVFLAAAGVALVALANGTAHAGAQQYEQLAASVRASLHQAVSDTASPLLPIGDESEHQRWREAMSARLAKRIPDARYRDELLGTIHYEATRAGLDPQLVLGLIEVESNFRKYAVSSAGARGYMQIMPFWLKVMERPQDNLFHLRTNLRYGCTILRHYLDIEKGDLFRALGRYNGSLGKAEYPNLVRRAWEQRWQWPSPPPAALAAVAGTPAATR